MRLVKALADELSEADLAVFGIEDHEDMATTGLTSIGYSLDALPDRSAFLDEAARHVAHARRSKHPLCFGAHGRRGTQGGRGISHRGDRAVARCPSRGRS